MVWPHIGGEFTVSPSGRYIVYANGLGGVLQWDVEHRSGPVRSLPRRRPPTRPTSCRYTG